MEEMRYPLVNIRLGQAAAAGQNMVLTKDVNAFYQTALDAANGIAAVAQAHDLSDDEKATINQQLGKIRDYTIPMTQPPACPPAPSCPACPACGAPAPCPSTPSEGNSPLLVAGAALVAGLVVGAFIF